MSRRKKQTTSPGAAKVSGDRKSGHAGDVEAQLTGREPNNPPRKNRFFLLVSIAFFTLWVGFLIWLAAQKSL